MWQFNFCLQNSLNIFQNVFISKTNPFTLGYFKVSPINLDHEIGCTPNSEELTSDYGILASLHSNTTQQQNFTISKGGPAFPTVSGCLSRSMYNLGDNSLRFRLLSFKANFQTKHHLHFKWWMKFYPYSQEKGASKSIVLGKSHVEKN